LESATLYQDLERQYLGTVTALATAMEARDPYTSGHSRRVARYATRIAEHMGLSARDTELQQQMGLLHRGALLHDVGKIGIPDQILLKPGYLTEEEWVVMRQHPVIGCEILHAVPGTEDIVDMVLHHHERMDGQGYPDGLGGEEIPFMVRVLSVADGFEAMTSKRAYRKARSVDQALAILREGAGVQWDEEVVKALHSYLRWQATDKARQIDQKGMGFVNDGIVPQAQFLPGVSPPVLF